MREPGVGRVLVASLHQAISEVLPTRLGFYESFLPAEGLRGGTIGTAPLLAVISFLRQEGAAYDRITMLAGEYAAEWTVQSMPFYRRAIIGIAPSWLRTRIVLGLARRLVRATCEKSRARSRMRRGAARIQLRDSMFCEVREPFPQPLCQFYAAAFARLLSVFDVRAEVDVESCRATDRSATACVVRLSFVAQAAKAVAEETAA